MVRAFSGLLLREADGRHYLVTPHEKLAIAVQASLMARHASDDATEAFVATRIAGEGGRQLGTLPSRFIPPDLPSNLGPAA